MKTNIMVYYKEEVIQWFRNSEPHHRLELVCGLLNMCLPLELKFINTCLEDLGRRDFHDLAEAQSKANNSEEVSKLTDEALLDDKTLSQLVVFVALLNPVNHTCSSLLYRILVDAHQRTSHPQHVKEMLLIYTMVLHHPAFTFEQKRFIAELLAEARSLEDRFCAKDEDADERDQQETCDSGLSVGTETEGDITTEGSGLLPTPVAQLHHHFHDPHKHGIESGVGSHATSQLTGESGNSQDACSSGSGESGELYNDGGTVPTTYIYNSSIFDQQSLVALSNDLLSVAPGYQCNHAGSFHYYQYPPVMGAAPGAVSGTRGPISEGSSSEDNGGGGVVSHSRPPTTSSPLSSPQSSPYVSPLQSLSPSRASSPWSRLNTTTTTTTTTTAAALPIVTSSTTSSSVSSLSSTHSSPQLNHKVPVTGTQSIDMVQSTQSMTVTSQAHRGKPPASGCRTQRQSDRSGSRTRVAHSVDTDKMTANQNQTVNSPSAARCISANCGGHTKNSSRWQTNSSSPPSSTSTTTSSAKNVTRPNSQSPSLNCGAITCRIPASCAVTSSSGCKPHHASSNQEGNGATSTLNCSSAISNSRNTACHGGGGATIDKNVHTVSNTRPSSSSSENSSAVYNKSSNENSAVINNNRLDYELCKSERLNKYHRVLQQYSVDELRQISDNELLNRGITKGALTKIRRLLTTNHRLNGYSNAATCPHSQSSNNSHHHIPYSLSQNSSSVNNHSVNSIDNGSTPVSQNPAVNHTPSSTPSNNLKPKASNTKEEAHSSSLTSQKNDQVLPEVAAAGFASVDETSGSYSKASSQTTATSSSSQQQSQNVSHNTAAALPYSQSSSVVSTSTIAVTSTSVVESDGVLSSAASSIPSSIVPSSAATAANNTTAIATSTVGLSCTTTTTANITTTTNVTQCHAYTVSPSQKNVSSAGVSTPSTSSSSSSSSTPIISNQGSHSSSSQHNSFCANQTVNSVPTCVSPSNGVPHYMTTPPPPIHHKTPPLPPGPHRTPPPPLGAPPRTPSREPSSSSTNNGYMSSSGNHHMYYASSNGSSCKVNSSISSPLPLNGPGSMSSSANVSLPVYTSSGSIAVPPPNSGGLLPMVPPGSQYHPPAYLYPFLAGGGPGGHTYVPPGAYAAQHSHRPYYIPALAPFAHMKPVPPQSGPPIIGNSRGGSSSSSSSCSSSSSSGSSNRGFKKVNQRNGPAKVAASHSSDSSPSSSQYSSPPQTPSPDHTRDSNMDKRGKCHSETTDNGEGGDSLTLGGSSEDGSPPPMQPQPLHILPAHAPLPRQRFMPYQPVAVWAPPGMIRYQSLSLPSQGPGVAPRNPVPLTNEKSSRETTPPVPVTMSVVQQDPQCCVRTPADGCAVPTTSSGGSIHSRNGGSPHAAHSHHEGSLPPPPPSAHNPVPSVASAPVTGQIPPGNACPGGPHTSVQYNATGYPMFMGAAHMFPHFPSFVPSHSSALSNGFVPPTIPPNFAFPAMSNGMNAEFMYGGQYPFLAGTSQSSGGGNGGPPPAPSACGTPTGMGPTTTPGSGITASLPYPHFPPGLPHTHNPSAGAKKTCYNCGQPGHRGAECKEASIEEMCKRTKDRLV